MQEQSVTDAFKVQDFLQGFLDKRTAEPKAFKEAHALCRKSVEQKFEGDREIKKILEDLQGHSLWVKDIMVNYVLLKMNHQAVLWEMDTAQPKPKQKKGPRYQPYNY